MKLPSTRANLYFLHSFTFFDRAIFLSRKHKHRCDEWRLFSRRTHAWNLDFYEKKNATCGLILYLSDCARTSGRKGGSSVEGIVAEGDRGGRKAGREIRVSKIAGANPPSPRPVRIRVYKCQEHTCQLGCSSTTLKTSPRVEIAFRYTRPHNLAADRANFTNYRNDL